VIRFFRRSRTRDAANQDESLPFRRDRRDHEELLRHALEAEASGVEVSPDALPEIRRRIQAGRARWWVPRPGRGLVVAVGAAVAAVAAIAVVVASTGERPSPAPPAASATPAGTPPASAGLTAGPINDNVPVYYAGRTRSANLLYREYHPVADDGTLTGRIRAAVTEALGRPLDPDYTSPWPAGTGVRDVSVDGSTATVELSGTTTAGFARQQLVWTVTAQDKGITGVRLILGGQPTGVLTRDPAADVLAPVWLYEPQQGARVGRTFTVQLAGIVFEGAIRLRVRSAGAVVSDQPVQLSAGAPAQGSATTALTLKPGRYTVEAYFVSVKDGSEQGLDDHEITVG
jgi:hypothetical protein